MKELNFKTNIKCGACETAVKPHLDKLDNTSWQVDLKHPDRILTVKGETDIHRVIKTIEGAGYTAEPI
ncbi:heavy-metal-associated domain-containing protein [Anditalea andensis]|uniref:Heavy metal transport/detoxification protein n=1 Tax=Anditalea andensis TaxID=1048983 RepID=A0A074L0A5_9BACT|nr:heavy metal-associated domain-containing protein [Anditalea andensis]KEO73308.1 heavy metal transport/detoxification protein [Anditalea andensis]